MAETSTAEVVREQAESPPPPPAATPFDALGAKIQSTYGDVLGARGEQQAGLEKKAAAVNPKLTAAQTATEDFARQIQEHRAELEASKPQITRPPSRNLSQYLAPHEGEPPEASVMKLLSGLTTFATGLGGLAKGDATAGLAAFKGALQGWHEGDKERADRAFADWKAKTDSALKQWEIERTSYHDWLEAGNLSLEHMLKGAELAAIKEGNNGAVDAFRTGTLEGALDFLQKQQNHADALELARARIAESHEKSEADRALRRELAEQSLNARIDHWRQQTTGGPGVAFTPEALELAAQTYVRTGQMPPLGMGKAGVEIRGQILNRAAELAKDMGGPEGQAARVATFKSNQAELTKLQTQRGPVMAFAQTADKNLDLAEKLSDKVDRSGTPTFNRWALKGRKSVAGDPDVSAFDAAVRVAINETAKVTSGASGGAMTSDTARREIETMLNSAMTKEQFKSVVQTLRQDMENRLQGFDAQIAQTKKALGEVKPGAAGGKIRVRRKSDGQTGTLDDVSELTDAYDLIK